MCIVIRTNYFGVVYSCNTGNYLREITFYNKCIKAGKRLRSFVTYKPKYGSIFYKLKVT